MSDAGSRVIGSMAPGHYGAARTGVVMSETTIAAAWNVQGDPLRASIVADVQQLFDVPLPLIPNTTCRSNTLVSFWLGPRSWLLVERSLPGRAAALVGFDAKRDVLNRGGGALFDVSASRVAYTLHGPQAATVLARSCPLDLDPRAFAAGHCAQSVLGRVTALFYRHEEMAAFTVMVARSLATDVWRGLCLAAAPDGYDVAAPAPLSAA